MFKYTSKVGIANPKSNSLRVGLPKEVVQLLDLNAGNSIVWGVDVTNNEITITVSKA